MKGFDDTMNANRMNDTMKIRISQLPLGVHEYHFTCDPAKLGLENNFSEPVEVDAVVDKTSGQLYLTVDITTSGQFQCDRCIEDFSLRLKNHYGVFYVYDEMNTGKYPADDVQVITPDTVSIDLTKDVGETVLLSVPIKLLCTEDCKGLCQQCGTNRNNASCECRQEWVDSRWQGLEGLNIE